MHLRVPSIMLLLAASLVLAAPARATGVDAIIGILTDLGHGVVEESADDGPNLVVDDGAWAISLADCDDRADCAYGWVYARRELAHYVYADCANDWNGQEPYGTAWIDNMSQPWLVATLPLQGDPGPDAIRAALDWYRIQLARFEAYIDTCPPIDREAL